MAIIKRTTELPTQQEQQIFAQVCVDKNVVTHGSAGETNINVIADFLERWGVVVNEESMMVSIQKLGEANQISFYSAAEARYRKIAAQEPGRAEELSQWFYGGLNKVLVKEGDAGFSNLTALHADLTGREINSPNIYDSIGRLSNKGLVHFVPVQKSKDSRQHVDDGSGFLRDEKNPRFKNGRINHAFREPQEEAPKAETADAWQEMCQKMLGVGPHSRQAEMLRIYTSPGKTFRQIYQEMLRLKNSYERVGRL